MGMKKFEVEFKKTSWMIVTVEAEGVLKDACWDIDGVWEVQEKEQA